MVVAVQILETKVDNKFEDANNTLATKEDLANLKGELKTDIANSKAEMLKWMFIFWASQLVAIFTLLKFLK